MSIPGRIYAADPGAPFRQTDAQVVKKGGLWDFDGVQPTLTFGNGDVIWFIDTTAANVTVTLPDAADTVSIVYTVKRKTAGANTLTVATIAGNIDGAATKSMGSQYDVFSFTSDGTQYWII
jgi:hypothetical protein